MSEFEYVYDAERAQILKDMLQAYESHLKRNEITPATKLEAMEEVLESLTDYIENKESNIIKHYLTLFQCDYSDSKQRRDFRNSQKKIKALHINNAEKVRIQFEAKESF